jgi:hypothetical protein
MKYSFMDTRTAGINGPRKEGRLGPTISLRVAMSSVIILAASTFLVSQQVRGPQSLTAADSARLAMLQEAISTLEQPDRLICLGVSEPELGSRPGNPPPQLLEGLRSAARILPITECVDLDQKSGQTSRALFMEAQGIDWQGDRDASMTVKTWSSDLSGATTRVTAHRLANDLWEASTESIADASDSRNSS